MILYNWTKYRRVYMKKRSKIALAALLLLVIGVILFKKESDSKDKTALVNINIEKE